MEVMVASSYLKNGSTLSELEICYAVLPLRRHGMEMEGYIPCLDRGEVNLLEMRLYPWVLTDSMVRVVLAVRIGLPVVVAVH